MVDVDVITKNILPLTIRHLIHQQRSRLWNPGPLKSTLKQLQEIRLYYEFKLLDIDRYMVNGNRSMRCCLLENWMLTIISLKPKHG